MARVRVLVDDYERGRLPGYCVVTGERVDTNVEVRTEFGPGRNWFSELVLILVTGPLGIAYLWITGNQHELVGSLPVSAEAWDRVRRGRRLAAAIAAVGAAGSAVAVAVLGQDAVFVAAVAIVVAGVVWLTRPRLPRTELDATRRWLLVDGAHEAFVDAVQAAERGRAGTD